VLEESPGLLRYQPDVIEGVSRYRLASFLILIGVRETGLPGRKSRTDLLVGMWENACWHAETREWSPSRTVGVVLCNRSHRVRNEMRLCADAPSQAHALLQLVASKKAKRPLHDGNGKASKTPLKPHHC